MFFGTESLEPGWGRVPSGTKYFAHRYLDPNPKKDKSEKVIHHLPMVSVYGLVRKMKYLFSIFSLSPHFSLFSFSFQTLKDLPSNGSRLSFGYQKRRHQYYLKLPWQSSQAKFQFFLLIINLNLAVEKISHIISRK